MVLKAGLIVAIFMHMAWERESWKLLAAANLVATRSHSPSRHAPEKVAASSTAPTTNVRAHRDHWARRRLVRLHTARLARIACPCLFDGRRATRLRRFRWLRRPSPIAQSHVPARGRWRRIQSPHRHRIRTGLFEPKSPLRGNGIFRAETKRSKRPWRFKDAGAETKSR